MTVKHIQGGRPCRDPYCWCNNTNYKMIPVEKESQLDIQVDGNHYKNLAIQPALYSHANQLSWHQGEIIKYVTRYKNKNGKADLEKAKHLIDMLVELEYDVR